VIDALGRHSSDWAQTEKLLLRGFEQFLTLMEDGTAWAVFLYAVATGNGIQRRRMATVGFGSLYVLAHLPMVWWMGEAALGPRAVVRPMLFQIAATVTLVFGWHAVLGFLNLLEFVLNKIPSAARLPMRESDRPPGWKIFRPKPWRKWMEERSNYALGLGAIWLRYGPLNLADIIQVATFYWGTVSLFNTAVAAFGY